MCDADGGRASNTFIWSDSGFFNCFNDYDKIMADWGFHIMEELKLRYCTWGVSPGAWIKSKMTSWEVEKTKKIADLKIHVQHDINWIKSHRILKSVLTLLHNCDDVVQTKAGLDNLKTDIESYLSFL